MAAPSSILAWDSPMDKAVWRATVHGASKETQLGEWTTTTYVYDKKKNRRRPTGWFK